MNAHRTLLAASVLSLAALAVGCAAAPAEATDSAADPEAVGETTQAWVSPDYESIDDSVQLWRTDLGFCFLTTVSGDLLPRTGDFELGRGAHLVVRSGSWWLDANGVEAHARCVAWSDIKFGGSGKLFSAPDGWSVATVNTKVPLWGPSTLCFLGGVGNGFEGGAQRIQVARDASGWSLFDGGTYKTVWSVFGVSREPVAGSGAAMCVDTQRTTPWRKTDFSWAQGQPETWMMKTTDGACMLTGIAGGFAGAGERVEIAEDSGYWVLRGTSAQEGVSATAQCVPYSQLVLTKPLQLGGL